MLFKKKRFQPSDDRGPLRVMFVITSMPIGGMETLLAQILRRMDRERFAPELCCLKFFEPFGEELAKEIPAFTGLLKNKYDLRVLPKLTQLLKRRRIDAVVTVGTGGDKMFWGRLAAYCAGVPVICSALHSTGLPDHVERMNRMLAPITDAFIGVAEPHAKYLAEHEGCPANKVRVIPNGVDIERFCPLPKSETLRASVGLPEGAPTVGIVAALRPEKNHELFLRVAARVRRTIENAHFLVVGDGVRRADLERLAGELGIGDVVHFVGSRKDVPQLLSQTNVFLLTSHMEASPVSILEAMACELPIVATRVGSIPESVVEGETGYMAPAGDEEALAARVVELLSDPQRAERMGRAGRERALRIGSVQAMVSGYENLIREIYDSKAAKRTTRQETNRTEKSVQI